MENWIILRKELKKVNRKITYFALLLIEKHAHAVALSHINAREVTSLHGHAHTREVTPARVKSHHAS